MLLILLLGIALHHPVNSRVVIKKQKLPGQHHIGMDQSIFGPRSVTVAPTIDSSRPFISQHKIQRYQKKCNGTKYSKEACDKLLKDIVLSTQDKAVSKQLPRSLEKYRLCLNPLVPFMLESYDPEKKLCCNGLFNKSEHQDCCNGSIINSKLQFCCQGEIYNKSNESQTCCGTFTYSVTTHICCKANLYALEDRSNTTCCGDQVYDMNEQICCFNKRVFNKTLGNACCGKKVYDTESEICCNAVKQPIKRANKKYTACCNKVSYDSMCYTCTNESNVLPSFNESNEICCNNLITVRRYNNSVCCGNQEMNNDCQTCEENGTITDKHTCRVEGQLTVWTSWSSCDYTKCTQIRQRICEPPTANIYCLGDQYETQMCPDGTCRDNSEQTTGSQLSVKRHAYAVGEGSTQRVVIVVTSCSVVVFVSGILYVLKCGCHKRRNSKFKYPSTQYTVAENHLYSSFATVNSTANADNYAFSLSSNSNIINCTKDKNLKDVTRGLSSDDTTHHLLSDYAKDGLMKFNYMSNFFKEIEDTPGNLLSDHVKESTTQTGTGMQTNKRNIFGKLYEHTFFLSSSEVTLLIPKSEAVMTLPRSFLDGKTVEVNCSKFDSLPHIRNKFDIPADETIASPVVEYSLTGYSRLPKYACVKLPFLGKPNNLKVKKFLSDDGLHPVAISVEIPLKAKTNEEFEAYYEIHDRYVCIYTYTFSGFYCTTCTHKRDLKLRAFIFGSHKRLDRQFHDVGITLYIADEIFKFEDFKQRLFENETLEGRTLLKDRDLKLPNNVTENSFIEAFVKPFECADMWMHKQHDGAPIYDELQKIRCSEVVQKCNCNTCPSYHSDETLFPRCREWILSSVPGKQPNFNFQCIVNVNIVVDVGGINVENKFFIQELQLRKEDTYPIQEGREANCIRNIKNFISSVRMKEERRRTLLEAIGLKYNVNYINVETTFNKLNEVLKPKGIIDAVISLLHNLGMTSELDIIWREGMVPQEFMHRSELSTGESQEDGDPNINVQSGLHHEEISVSEVNSECNNLVAGASINNYQISSRHNSSDITLINRSVSAPSLFSGETTSFFESRIP